MRRVLMVAFHFPPATGSSGLQRTLRFVQHLPEHGWEPVVLTVHPMAHERVSTDLLADIPAGTRVIRAFGLDTARHLSFKGRYPGFLARPDRWQSWRVAGTVAGLKALKALRCEAIWSTYPIATAHRIAASLQRHSGLPWVADFRDPMAQDGYPADPQTWRSFKAIEAHAIEHAQRSVFTTPGAARMYRERYASVPEERISIIENGYDESSFPSAPGSAPAPQPLLPGRVTLLHSGVIYPSERDPTQFFRALAMLKAEGSVSATNFCLRLRASGHDAFIGRLCRDAGIADLVELAPAIGYREALQEMMRADALIAMQASNCNAQVPAKLYEYLRAMRPILAFTDPTGDTAGVLQDAGVHSIAPLDDAAAIAELLRRFLGQASARSEWLASPSAVARASRASRTAELAQLLNQAAG